MIFFPTKGLLAVYDREQKTIRALPGADNPAYVQCNPVWSPDGRWIVFCQSKSYLFLQPDSRLYIIPAGGGEAREMRCNLNGMNSWHSWSPNSRWLVFACNAFSPYTQLFITHIDAQGDSAPPVALPHLTAPEWAINVPEFMPRGAPAIERITLKF